MSERGAMDAGPAAWVAIAGMLAERGVVELRLEHAGAVRVLRARETDLPGELERLGGEWTLRARMPEGGAVEVACARGRVEWSTA